MNITVNVITKHRIVHKAFSYKMFNIPRALLKAAKTGIFLRLMKGLKIVTFFPR